MERLAEIKWVKKIIEASIYLGIYERNVGEPIHIGISSILAKENFFLANSSSIKSIGSVTSWFNQNTSNVIIPMNAQHYHESKNNLSLYGVLAHPKLKFAIIQEDIHCM